MGIHFTEELSSAPPPLLPTQNHYTGAATGPTRDIKMEIYVFKCFFFFIIINI